MKLKNQLWLSSSSWRDESIGVLDLYGNHRLKEKYLKKPFADTRTNSSINFFCHVISTVKFQLNPKTIQVLRSKPICPPSGDIINRTLIIHNFHVWEPTNGNNKYNCIMLHIVTLTSYQIIFYTYLIKMWLRNIFKHKYASCQKKTSENPSHFLTTTTIRRPQKNNIANHHWLKNKLKQSPDTCNTLSNWHNGIAIWTSQWRRDNNLKIKQCQWPLKKMDWLASVDRGERSHFPATLYNSKITRTRKLRFGTHMQLILRQVRTNLCAVTSSGSPLKKKNLCDRLMDLHWGKKKRTFRVENRTVLYFKTNGGISTKFFVNLR